jgi:hypothetical protein
VKPLEPALSLDSFGLLLSSAFGRSPQLRGDRSRRYPKSSTSHATVILPIPRWKVPCNTTRSLLPASGRRSAIITSPVAA